jgi:hypothetical protein
VAKITKTVDGKQLAAEDFAYVGDDKDISTWHLPIDRNHVESALKLFGHEKNVPQAAMGATARKIAKAAKAADLDTKDFEAKYCKSSEHAEAPRPWMEIFRAGDYSKAGKGVITAADLSRVVRNYDPAFHEAPETLGHRSDDQPAYGWIDALALDGDTLLAREKQVDPKFAEARQAGKFKKRSAGFYCDENGQVTGLRHVAWLGAGVPEVKGLQDIAFNDHGLQFIEVDCGEDGTVPEETKTVAEQIKAYFAELFGGSAQPTKTFSEDDVKRIAGETAANTAKALDAKIIDLQTKLEAQTTKFAEQEKALAAAAPKQRAADAVNKLKAAGKWIPAFDVMGVPAIFEELAKSSETVTFGEGDAKKTVTPLEMQVTFMEGLPKIVPGGRLFEGSKSTGGKNATGDPLTDAAKARQKEKNITFGEALAQVAAEQPELTVAGTAAGGAV